MESMIKPFLLLQSRPEVEASDDEHQAFLEFGGLEPGQLVRLRLESGDEPYVNLNDYAGVIMGGGPANFAYDEAQKSPEQKQFESYILPLVHRIIETDTPFLGACLGVGAVVTAMGGRMSFDHPEAVGAVDIAATSEGEQDELFKDFPPSFRGFVGHKEGVISVPSGCTVLARSNTCVQILRAGNNVYATQFHPELDADGLALRINIYKHAGYFEPEEADALIANAQQESITWPEVVLRRFVERYHQKE